MTSPTSATERVGRYQLLEPIGIGPSGTVSRAKVFGVAGFERQFAVKRFHAELTATAAMAAMLSAAARAYGSLEHPRIARMSEFGVAQGATFTAVEYVVGLDALRLVGEAKLAGVTLAAGGALALVSQAARAVGYAHGRGLTHLGLAPTNVIVTADGDIKITDFGILSATLPSRPIDVPRLTQRIPYLAPEQLANEATSAATDVFALGVLAYELVTGARTFRGDTPQQVAQAIMGGPPPEPPLPRPIVRVLQRCLARSPFERFPDARALADALDAALRVAPVPGTRKDIGAQVKETLDRLAALNDGQMSGMVALHLGTGPIRRVPDEEVRASALGAPPEAPRDPSEMLTYELARPDLTGGDPAFAPPGTTMPDLPRPMTTVPGLAPPPIPVPPGVAPPPIPPAAAAGAQTLLGIGKPPGMPPVPPVRPRPGSASGLPVKPPALPPLRPGSKSEGPFAIESPAVAAQRDATQDSAVHQLDPSDVLALDDVADSDEVEPPPRAPTSQPFSDDFQDAPTRAMPGRNSGPQAAVEPPPEPSPRAPDLSPSERSARTSAPALSPSEPSTRTSAPALPPSDRTTVPALPSARAPGLASDSSGRLPAASDPRTAASDSSGRLPAASDPRTAASDSSRLPATSDSAPRAPSEGSGRTAVAGPRDGSGAGRMPDAASESGRTAMRDASGAGRMPDPASESGRTATRDASGAGRMPDAASESGRTAMRDGSGAGRIPDAPASESGRTAAPADERAERIAAETAALFDSPTFERAPMPPSVLDGLAAEGLRGPIAELAPGASGPNQTLRGAAVPGAPLAVTPSGRTRTPSGDVAPGDVPAVTDIADSGETPALERLNRTMIGVAAPIQRNRSASTPPAGSEAPKRPLGETQPEDIPEVSSSALAPPTEPPSIPPGPPPATPPGWITAPPPFAGPSPITPLGAPRGRRGTWVIVGMLGAAALGIGAWQLYERNQPATGDASPGSARPGETRPVVAAAPRDAATPDSAATPDAALAAAAPDAGARDAGTPDATKLAAIDAGAPDAAKLAAIDAGAAPTQPPPTPTAASGELVIASTPPGAHVYLDGADTGVTPVKLPGSPDRHNMALVLAGHELYVAQVDGHGSFQIPLKEVTPTNGPAGIKVLRCKPDRYYVFVDGVPTGQTCPTERIGCEIGAHTVEVYDVVSETRRKWDIVVKDTRLSFRVRVD